MFDKDEPKTVTSDHVVGCDLDALSVEEVQKRIFLLREEILRLEKAVSEKQRSLSIAASFFNR